MRRLRLLAVVGGLAVVLPGAVAATPASATPLDYTHLKPVQKRLLSGLAAFELDPAMATVRAAAARPARFSPTSPAPCALQRGIDVKVNQNCVNVSDADLQGRAQAQNETSIAIDPSNARHIVASYNDYRRGDGTCGSTFSTDGGHTWADSTVPNGFSRGGFVGKPREYWQGAGDTSVAWDTRGNAYLSCQVFNRGAATSPNPDASSAFYVMRSTGTNGASWNFTGRPVTANGDPAGTSGVLEDKQLLTVDASTTSPYRDRVYVTWTLFAADGTAYIYASHSADYGETFSEPVLVSGDSKLCPQTYGLPTPHGACNENQFSQPFTGPDGALYVTWANFNTSTSGGLNDGDGDENGGDGVKKNLAAAKDNHNQMLLARSTDGGETFSAPVQVGQYFDLPDCATYQGGANPGRGCVPEKGATHNSIFRATNYPSGSVDPTTGKVAVTYGSYVNRHSNETNGCMPTGFAADGGPTYDGVKLAGACNNDILVSVSTDHGATFTGTTKDARTVATVTNAAGQARTDQFWQWAAYSHSGRLVVSYYDRQYGFAESTGYSDISVTVGVGGAVRRATGASMPPPTQFSGAFAGDYTGLAVGGGAAHPLWTDTRAEEPFLCPGTGVPGVPPQVCAGSAPIASVANDQDAYSATVPLG